VRIGIDVLEHGLPALPETLSYQMALPVAYWKADKCAVVLILRFSRHGRGKPAPIGFQVTYSRTPTAGPRLPTFTARASRTTPSPVRATAGTWTAGR